MEKQMPVELEVSDPIEIELDPDLCVIKDMQGKNRLVIESKVSKSELENLARDCIDELGDIFFTAKYLGQVGGFNREMYLWRRLDTIEILLGKERFRKAIARAEEELDRALAEAEEIERNLEACKGRTRRWGHDWSLDGRGIACS